MSALRFPTLPFALPCLVAVALSSACAGHQIRVEIPGAPERERAPTPRDREVVVERVRPVERTTIEAKEIKAEVVSARVIYAKEVHARDGNVGRIEIVEEAHKGHHDGEIKTGNVAADTIHAKEIHADYIEADVIYAKEVKIGR